ncbi:Serine carboxypeptidase family protein [Pelomyxa schiedti]|nr:Serine carboxypeptidase family protein [Pelomyxa schiedti]
MVPVLLGLLVVTFCVTLDAAPAPVLHCGYVPSNETNNNHLYYYFVEYGGTTYTPKTAPLTIWLSGGPGVSSLTGAYLENGPYLCAADGTVTVNPLSWHTASNMIYFDQPAGTGYGYVGSSSSYVRSESQIASEFYYGLQQWFSLFPDYKSNPLFIFGESYAGKYIPAIANKILQENLKGATVNLHGLGLGDGWVYPYMQTRNLIPWAVALGLLGSREVSECQAVEDKFETAYQAAIDSDEDKKYVVAALAADEVTNCVITKAGNVDEYDVRYFNGDPLDPNIDALTVYLNTPDIKSSLNATTDWSFGNGAVQMHLQSDVVRPAVDTLTYLLDYYPIIVYSGQFDLVCNLLGSENILTNLDWAGNADYKNAVQEPWLIDGATVGFTKTARTLTHTIVLGASHQAPAAQPVACLDMFTTFLTKHS